MLLEIKVRPFSSKDEILSFEPPNRLELSLRAKPENFEANSALINFLAKLLKIEPKRIKILKGKTSRKKLVSLEGVSEKELWEKLSR